VIVHFRPEQLEISDRIVSFAPGSLQRLPVLRAQAAETFRAEGNAWGASIVEGLPVHADGTLQEDAIDALMLAGHRELQRLALELEQGARTALRLRPLLAALRERVHERPLVVVDVGCGLGYIIRWLAAHGELGPDVALHGADFNGALVGEAARLAELEGLRCTFHRQDAFALDVKAHVYLSTGMIHHLPGPELPSFFGAQVRAGALAWLHADFQPSALAPWGSWLFHRARMRLPLSVHDGILSAYRAHPGELLLSSASAGAPGWRHELRGRHVASWLPIPRAMHTLAGLSPALADVVLP
jgi:SAM-dependent methyltransferase